MPSWKPLVASTFAVLLWGGAALAADEYRNRWQADGAGGLPAVAAAGDELVDLVLGEEAAAVAGQPGAAQHAAAGVGVDGRGFHAQPARDLGGGQVTLVTPARHDLRLLVSS